MPLPVCRVCLSSNIMTVHSVTDIQLRVIYEKLTGIQFNTDNVPQTLCHYCYWRLQQCCKLIATALYSHKMLRKVMDCNTKNGLKFIHSLPKSRHLSTNTLKSISFNGESNETTCEYPRQMMMREKNLSKPNLGSLADYIPEKLDSIINSPVTKQSDTITSSVTKQSDTITSSVIKQSVTITSSITKQSDTITSSDSKQSVKTKSLKTTSVMKQHHGAISEQLSLQCLLTDKPGLVITKQKKPVITRNKKIKLQEALEINETKHKTGDLQCETQATIPAKQDLETGTFNEKEHEMKKQVNETCKIEIFDDNSQSGDSSQHLQFHTGSVMDTSVIDTNQPIFYLCNICKKIYKTQENLNQHKKTHNLSEDIIKKKEPTLCLICNKYVISMNSHKIVHSKERRYVCDICGHRSRTKDNLGTHLRVHTDEPEIVCEVCNKGFKHKSSYVYHKNIHTGERPFSCHICGGTYKQSGQVRAHIRLVHEGIKQFCCDICGKKFGKRHKFLIHLNAHANIKPYSCDKCQKLFRTASIMRRHIARYCKVNKI